MSVAYSYDGTFDGLLSAVFTAYARREEPEEIVPAGELQQVFGRMAREIRTDDAQARRVEAGIISKLGSPCYQTVWTAFLSCESQKATHLYRYIRRGFKIGRGIYNDIAHDDVAPVEKMRLNIGREAHLLTGFTRFSEMEGGVWYGKITPKNSVVPLLMPHFSDRFPTQPFLLHDPRHALVGVYNLQGWHLVETDFLTVPPPAENELNYRRMWKSFYETIAIPERINPVCRRTHMPFRYWPNMTEHGFIPAEKQKNAPIDAAVLSHASSVPGAGKIPPPPLPSSE